MDCNNCGYCCENLLFHYPVSTNSREFLEARGFRLEEKNMMFDAYLYHPCPHLVKHSKNKAKCKIYENRPEACKRASCPKEKE